MCKNKDSCMVKTILILSALGAGMVYFLKNYDVKVSIRRKPVLIPGEPEAEPEVYVPEYVDMDGAYEADVASVKMDGEQTISEADAKEAEDVISLSEPQETVDEDWDKKETEIETEAQQEAAEEVNAAEDKSEEAEDVHYQKL